MHKRELNELLVAAFPELTNGFREYTSWQDGLDTGGFLVFEDVFLPMIRKALLSSDSELLSRVGKFIEELVTSGDEYALNVAIVGVLEDLKANGDGSIREYLGAASLAEYDSLEY